MKLKGILLTSALSAMLGVGVFAGVSGNKDAAPVEKAEAAVISSYTYYFTDNYSFDWNGSSHSKAIYAYAYNTDSDKNAGWPGVQVGYSLNENEERVYVYSSSKSYSHIIWHNNDNARAEVDSSTARGWYVTGWKQEWDGSEQKTNTSTWTPKNQTYYFYDYRNLFGGNAKCYAWQSNGSLESSSYPGPVMTKVQYGSGQLYSVTLAPAFDMFKIGIGDSANTGDQQINEHRGQCFAWWNTGDSGWISADNAKAHDWVFQTMHIRDILTTNNSDTNACRESGTGAKGYYAKAKLAYETSSYCTAAVKTELAKITEFTYAKARFVAWAEACGEHASFDGTSLSYSTAVMPFNVATNETAIVTTTATVIVSIIAISTAAGFLFLKKKKNF